MSQFEHEKYMQLAIRKAQQGVEKGQTPFGACIVRDGEVLSCSHNQVWKTTDITAHAEVVAIRAACKKAGTIDLSGSVIYSTCEPCPMCFSACHWANISAVVYGASIKDADDAGFHELSISNRRMKTLGQSPVHIHKRCLIAENRNLFQLWMKKKDRRAY